MQNQQDQYAAVEDYNNQPQNPGQDGGQGGQLSQDELNELAGEMDPNAILPSEDDLETYRIVFELFDRDRSGFIDQHDLAAISQKLGKDPNEGKTVDFLLKSLKYLLFNYSFRTYRRFRCKSRWPRLLR